MSEANPTQSIVPGVYRLTSIHQEEHGQRDGTRLSISSIFEAVYPANPDSQFKALGTYVEVGVYPINSPEPEPLVRIKVNSVGASLIVNSELKNGGDTLNDVVAVISYGFEIEGLSKSA